MQAERTERESAIEKVRKMLALAAENSGATEAERMLATQRAQEFMFRHNLDMLEVEQTEGGGPDYDEDETLVAEGQRTFWRGTLFNALGHETGVFVFYTPINRTKRRYTLIGRPDAISFLRELANYLIPYLEIECEAALIAARAAGETQECTACDGEGVLYGRYIGSFAPDECPKCDGTGRKPIHAKTFRNTFYDAAITRIRNRLAVQRHALEKASQESDGGTGMELVRNERKALDEHVKRAHPDLMNSSSSRSTYSAAGDRAGHAAGDRADLASGAKLRGGQRQIGRG